MNRNFTAILVLEKQRIFSSKSSFPKLKQFQRNENANVRHLSLSVTSTEKENYFEIVSTTVVDEASLPKTRFYLTKQTTLVLWLKDSF